MSITDHRLDSVLCEWMERCFWTTARRRLRAAPPPSVIGHIISTKLGGPWLGTEETAQLSSNLRLMFAMWW